VETLPQQQAVAEFDVATDDRKSRVTEMRYQSSDEDSARWDGFPFRQGDIVISTRSKSGTTWMQMICALLVFQTPELPAPLATLSPWLDWLIRPRDAVVADLEAQQHRRFIKTHTPLDGIPIDPRASYIVVARHPLDMAVSLFHQGDNLDRERIAALLNAGHPTADKSAPEIAGRPAGRSRPADPAEKDHVVPGRSGRSVEQLPQGAPPGQAPPAAPTGQPTPTPPTDEAPQTAPTPPIEEPPQTARTSPIEEPPHTAPTPLTEEPPHAAPTGHAPPTARTEEAPPAAPTGQTPPAARTGQAPLPPTGQVSPARLTEQTLLAGPTERTRPAPSTEQRPSAPSTEERPGEAPTQQVPQHGSPRQSSPSTESPTTHDPSTEGRATQLAPTAASTVRASLLRWIDRDANPADAMDSLAGVLWHLSDAWRRRHDPNILLVHYADLVNDLEAEMRRIAERLDITVPEESWPALVKAAGFAEMRRNAANLAPDPAGILKDRHAFFRRGSSGAGRELLTDAEFAHYEQRAAVMAPADLLEWLHR
jgi:hypothetical protein